MSKEFRKAARQAFRFTKELRLDICVNHKEKDNKCQLNVMKQNVEANGVGGGKTFRLDEKNNEPDISLRRDGFSNNGFDFRLHDDSFVTETTEIPPKEAE